MTQRLEQLGPYTLVQREGVFPLGGDALALGGFATLRSRWRVCDLGTGSGALLLLLARREPTLDLWGLDSSQEAVDCTRESLDRSGLTGSLWAGPWSACPFPAGTFDLVVSNPPYFIPGRGKQGGPGRMEQESLDSLCAAAARLLRNGGRFALCHRPERLPQLMRGDDRPRPGAQAHGPAGRRAGPGTQHRAAGRGAPGTPRAGDPAHLVSRNLIEGGQDHVWNLIPCAHPHRESGGYFPADGGYPGAGGLYCRR